MAKKIYGEDLPEIIEKRLGKRIENYYRKWIRGYLFNFP